MQYIIYYYLYTISKGYLETHYYYYYFKLFKL